MIKLKSIIKLILKNFFSDYYNWVLWIPVLFSIGILLRFYYTFSLSIIFPFTTLYLSIIYKNKKIIYIILITISTILIGYVRTNIYIKNKYTYTIDKKYERIRVSGVINDISYFQKINNYEKRLIIKVENMSTLTTHPKKIRVSLNSKINLEYGDYIEIVTDLYPLPKQTFKSIYDSNKALYFEEIGALGTNTFIEKIEKRKITLRDKMYNIRENINNRFISASGSRKGSIIGSFITGIRGRIFNEDYKKITNAGLVHLIAISGMNMSIVMGYVYIVIRWILAHFQYIALNYDTKKIASIFSIFFGFLYLSITGFPVSANRAYIMSVLYFIGILIDKERDVKRFISFTALFLLFFQPNLLFDAGFLLSFFAVLGLVAGFDILNELNIIATTDINFLKPLFYIYLNFISSILAQIFTIPISIYFFNSFSTYSIFTNIIAIPLTSIITLPFAIISIFFFPFHIEKYILIPANWSIDFILKLSDYTLKLPNSIIIIQSPTFISLFLMILGVLWISLWSQKWKFFGLVFFLFGFIILFFHKNPDVFINKENKLLILNINNELYFSKKINNFKSQQIEKKFGFYSHKHIKDYCNELKNYKDTYTNCLNFINDIDNIFINNEIEKNFYELNKKYNILEKNFNILIN